MKNLLLILTIFSLSLSSCKKEKDMNPKSFIFASWQLVQKKTNSSGTITVNTFSTNNTQLWNIKESQEVCITTTNNNLTNCSSGTITESAIDINSTRYNVSLLEEKNLVITKTVSPTVSEDWIFVR